MFWSFCISSKNFQVLSPLTGQILGMSEVLVLKQKESVTEMRVRVLTGLGIRIGEDEAEKGRQRKVYNVETTYSKKLSAKYQVRRKNT
jgi:hypothetical protein